MGLSELLANPQLIGMAMAGLSRDREAPMNAMKSLTMVEDINRRRMEEARLEEELKRKELARAENMKLIAAMSQAQNANSGSLSDAIMAMQGLRNVPQTTQQFSPDQQAGTAVDLETGQSYAPQEVANPQKSQAYMDFLNKYALSKGRPQLDLSQFPNADPNVAMSAMTHMQANDPRNSILKMVEDEQNRGDTRAWEREKLGIQNENAIKLEGVKAGNKADKKSNYALMFEEAFGRPPQNSKEFLAFIKQTKESPNIKVNTGSRERFHYSTDKQGNVWQINQDTREKINLGQIGRPGTMGFLDTLKEAGGNPSPETKPDPLGIRK